MTAPAAGWSFNRHGVWAIYRFEMARAVRTLVQRLVTPVITTSLYFVVFGAAIGGRMTAVNGVGYGAFIVRRNRTRVYLISGFRWCFYGTADVSVTVSFVMTIGFLLGCLAVVSWIFKTGYRLKN